MDLTEGLSAVEAFSFSPQVRVLPELRPIGELVQNPCLGKLELTSERNESVEYSHSLLQQNVTRSR